MLFSKGEKGILSRANFEWNKNEFCLLFRHTRNAEEFIAVWQDNTTFNKVTQSAEPITAELELDRSISDDHSYNDAAALPSSQTSATKRPAEEPISQCVSKKKCISSISPLDESIEAKKAGMYCYYFIFTLIKNFVL